MSKKRSDKALLVVLAVVIMSCVVAIIILMSASAEDPSFFSIIGTLLSAILGALIVLFTSALTIRHSQTQLDEQLRLQSLPFLTAILEDQYYGDINGSSPRQITFNSELDVFETSTKKAKPATGSENDVYCHVFLTNIGVAPAIDITVQNERLGHLPVSTHVEFISVFPANVENAVLVISFSDRENRIYTQTLKIPFERQNKSSKPQIDYAKRSPISRPILS